jgi:ribosome-binding protein aMBF1 (putative translation factor)
MGRCQQCGVEIDSMFLRDIWLENKSVRVCQKCYSEIERNQAEKRTGERKAERPR